MGLAPMHAWLPDAHSEAPAPASALLSGGLLTCAFLALLRGVQVCLAAGLGGFVRPVLVAFGLLSLTLSAAFIIGQQDFKRLLAYSSMEHMGILALGVGVGGVAAWGAMLHALGHGLAKGLLFLTAGNLLAAYGSKAVADVRGAIRRLPISGPLWVAGFLAIAGAPPFGLFLSELTILKGILDAGRWVVAALYLGALAAVFAGMAGVVLRMALGQSPTDELRAGTVERASAVLPPLALGVAVLVLGVWIPAPLRELLTAAARLVGGGGG